MNFRRCVLGLVSILVSTSSAMAMTPGKELALRVSCNYQNIRTGYGSVSLIRLDEGSFVARGSVELSTLVYVSKPDSYESEDGYTVVPQPQQQQKQQQPQQMQPEYRSISWDGPKVETLKEAVHLYRQHMLRIGYQCSYWSPVEVKNW